MPCKNATIKFRATSELKNKADSLALKFSLPKEAIVEAIFYLGLQSIETAILEGDSIIITHDLNSSSKRVLVQKKNHKRTKNYPVA